MTDDEWEWLVYWCVVRARVTGTKQRIYSCRIGDGWEYWSTAAGAGYGHSEGDQVRREMTG